jgi:homoserine O-acetyltransferase
MNKEEYKVYNLGNVKLLSEQVLKSATLAYQTYGVLNSKKDNVILLPTFYTGTHQRNEGFIGTNRAIDPSKYFIISINMFGNGLSSSPSNASQEQRGSNFPLITLWDNIYCQHRLLKEEFEINQLALVTGWSMAGCQSYQWASQFPEMVKAILPFCSSAKTSPHNFVFLEGIKAALCADGNWNNGNYSSPPIKGLKAFARVYASWAFSQTFYRDEHYKKIGYNSIEELLIDWENDHVNNWDANNLLSKLSTWQDGDISIGPLYNKDFKKALQSISARVIIIPCKQDLYFRVEDNHFEARYISNSQVNIFDSPFGHCVANPGNDKKFEIELDKSIFSLLS